MTSQELFGWGALGGSATYAIAFVLPALKAFAGGDSRPEFVFWRISVATAVGLLYCFLGGVAAIAIGNSSTLPGQALAIGAVGELALKSILQDFEKAEPLPPEQE